MAPPPTLQWPPPGLEPMRGRLYQLARLLGIADGCFLAAIVAFAVFLAPAVSRIGISSPAATGLGIALFGSLLLLGGAREIWRLLSEGGTHVWRGYTWLTIAEVMADRRGDSGALISGADEYGAQTPRARSMMRMGRLVRAIAILFAALLPMPILLAVASLGAGVVNGLVAAISATILPSAALMLAAGAIDRIETMALRPARLERLKRFERRTDAIRIADAWYTSFESARDGQSLGRGPAGGALRAWIAGAAASAMVVGIAVVFLPLWFLAASGSVAPRAAMDASWTRISSLNYLRRFAAQPDRSITPRQAGDAFHTLALRGQPARPGYVRPPARNLPNYPRGGDTLFRTRINAGWPGPRSPDVLDSVKKSVSHAQREYLQRIAADSGWQEFHIVATAPRVDFAGGELALPLPADLSPLSIPGVAFTASREVAYANSARAALLMADGHLAEAEQALRETIAFGFHLADDGYTTIDVLVGAIVVGIGRDALEHFYALTGSAQYAVLRGADDRPPNAVPPPNASPGVVPFRPPPAASRGAPAAVRRVYTVSPANRVLANMDYSRESVVGRARDLSLPRGVRLDAVRATAMMACGNFSDLLFGLRPEIRAGLAMSRAQFVQSPADSALFELQLQVIDRPVERELGGRPSSTPGILVFGARVSSWVLRRARIANCALLLGTGGF